MSQPMSPLSDLSLGHSLRRSLQRSFQRTGPALLLLCAGALSCDSVPPAAVEEGSQSLTIGSDTELLRTLRSIEVNPISPVLQADLNTKATQSFKVLARYNDRSIRDVTAAASFTVDSPMVGSVTGGTFESAARATTQIDATAITVRYKEGAVEATVKVNLTVVWLRTSGPTKDLFFTLPHMAPAQSQTAAFGTSYQSLDAFLAVDTTGSMGSEITALKSGLDTTLVPAVQAAVRDSWFGVGAVEDFPSGSYGSPGCNGGPDDQPFILLSAMGSDLMATRTAVASLLRGAAPRGCGADTPEGQMEALYQIATGAGNVVGGVVNIPAHKDKGRGGVEFRTGSLPVVAMLSDASFHSVGDAAPATCYMTDVSYTGATAMAAHTRTATATALKNLCARVVGLSVVTVTEEGCLATKDLRQMATDTGAVVPPEAWDAGTRPAGCAAGQCCTGMAGAGEAPNASGLCPLVTRLSRGATDVGAQLGAGITRLARFSPSEVSLVLSGVTTAIDGTALPAGKTTADFLQPVKPVDGTAPAMPSGLKAPVVSGDRFTGVIPGSTLRFTVEAKNDFITSSSRPQSFKAKLTTMASGCAVLDERDVLILVPAS